MSAVQIGEVNYKIEYFKVPEKKVKPETASPEKSSEKPGYFQELIQKIANLIRKIFCYKPVEKKEIPAEKTSDIVIVYDHFKPSGLAALPDNLPQLLSVEKEIDGEDLKKDKDFEVLKGKTVIYMGSIVTDRVTEGMGPNMAKVQKVQQYCARLGLVVLSSDGNTGAECKTGEHPETNHPFVKWPVKFGKKEFGENWDPTKIPLLVPANKV